MRLHSSLLGLWLACGPVCGFAQVVDLRNDHVPTTELHELVRFHTGDDSRWSEPDFDDSAWPLISSEKDWAAQGYKDYGGFAWYRFRVILPPEHAQLGLYIPPIRTSYQVFADGKLVGSFGGFPPNATGWRLHPHLVLMPPARGGHIEIAMRVWHWPGWASYFGGGFTGAPRIGDVDQLRYWMTLQDRDTFWELSAQDYLALLNFLYGAAGLVLFLMRRRERLYFWYGLTGLLFCGWSLMNVYTAFYDVPEFASEALTNGGFATAGFFSFLMFVWMMMGSRRKVWIWVALVSVALSTLMWTLPPLLHLPVSVGNLILTFINLPLILIPVMLLVQGFRRGDPDARLLLIPVLFNTLANWINDGLWALHTSGHTLF